MDLKDFVKSTLCQISQGVKESQELVIEHGCEVNPILEGGNKIPNQGAMTSNKAYRASTIEFDVAVTATDEKSGKAGIRVLGVGTDGELKVENTTVSRVKFSINLALPPSEN